MRIRHGARITVLRGTRVHIARGAKINVSAGGCLVLGHGTLSGAPCSLTMRRNSRLTIHGDATIFRGTRIVVGDDAHLEIGHRSYVNFDSAIVCWEHIAIGADCAISWNVNILDGNAHELIVGGVHRPRTRPLSIGDNVWIGTGATVVGATVGDGSVVAAGSTVTSEVPPKALAAGNPARVARNDVAWRL
ncbi:MAG TPA: acyltransferase [Trebonia sp.]